MQSPLIAARQSFVSLPFLLPSWCELASLSGRRYQSTYRRTKQRLRIKPDESFNPSTEKDDTILFNPPSSAPNVFHTPSKFLPDSDVRKPLAATAPSGKLQAGSPEELPSANKPTDYKRTHVQNHITPEEVKEIRRLRIEDPAKWSRWKLARHFECSPRFIANVCEAIPQKQKYELQRQVLEAVKSRWGNVRRMAREDRNLRRQAWARDE
ncbi:hypothetical protein UA08_02096 [Talaromyces atroroseus]|uniref:54S ribosomal protein L20, mitochondrial n=1 Tax=Talaromyces atroroseus TaxID=1441469 RepID=A0A1Q5QBT9_TALAT|nr:hypothetical protein UA08_02096 [Talaromyces atroroseus]OKL63403.1 hypothetical protein UA08_02096 [Talaromyces atroroseus]